MASNKRKAAKGDIRVVKVCPYMLWAPGDQNPFPSPGYIRCSLEAGHRGDHLIRVANEADSVLDSKTGTGG